MSGISQEGTNYPATYEDYVPPGAVARALIDIFNLVYPVGSYYETTDTNFDPNVQFGGTWVLEDAGLVHVSAGAGYTVSTNSKDGGEATHTLLKAELPHERYRIGQNMSGLGVQATWYLTYVNNDATGSLAGAKLHNTANGDWAYTEYIGSGQAHNNMQPYKIVNRWHRTA